ncbi:MAG: fluoride efflux transporter CrcB [Nocardioides sp.]
MVARLVLWGAFSVSAGCGATIRFLLDGVVSRLLPGSFPLGTMAVNLTGALALGVLDGAAASDHLVFVCGTGLIGAYTTFSTWMFETQRLTEERQAARATQNVVVSVTTGVAAAALGLWIGGGL